MTLRGGQGNLSEKNKSWGHSSELLAGNLVHEMLLKEPSEMNSSSLIFESWIPIIATQKVSKGYFVFTMRYTIFKLLRNYQK